EPARRDARARRRALSTLLVHRAGDRGLGRDRAYPVPIDRARDMTLHAVILAGGSGTRFWPLSRAKKPKQFLALATGRTLIAETSGRVEPISAVLWVVCGKDHEETVKAELPKARVIVEPRAKNTAPAIALACRAVEREDPDATIAVLPS